MEATKKLERVYTPLEEEQREAKAELIRAIRRAKRAGLKPDTIFVDEEGRLMMLKVQLFGLCLAILNNNIFPYAYYGWQGFCQLHNIPFQISGKDYEKLYYFGQYAMLAFGFGAGINALKNFKRGTIINAILKRPQSGDISMPPTQLNDVARGVWDKRDNKKSGD